jgi:hypothetical protein
MGAKPKPPAPRWTGACVGGVVLAALLVLYVTPYLALGSCDQFVDLSTGRVARVTRQYREKWLADVFYPLGIVEGWCRGIDVYLGYS